MFTKIDIKKFGLYKDFRWPSDMHQMNRINIIYGRNYSGKTTLSRIFDSVSLSQLHKDYLDGEFTIHMDDLTASFITEHNMNECPYMVRVYNTDYVNRNLSWMKNEESGEIKPFALIGSDNVEAQKAIDEIDYLLGSVEGKKGLLFAQEVEAKEYQDKKQKYEDDVTQLENQLKDKANNDIKKKKYFVEQGSTYNVTTIKKDIVGILKVEAEENEDKSVPTIIKYSLEPSVVLTEDSKAWLKKTIDEEQKTGINELPESEPHLKEYEEEVRTLVTKKIALTRTLQELVENDLLQAWVEDGRKLNKGRERCAFCGSPISKERWEVLDAHFSKESDELKAGLLELKTKLEKTGEALNTYLSDKQFVEERIYAAYVQEYKTVLLKWNEYVGWYKKVIERLIAMINERLGNLFKPITFERTTDRDLSLIPILKEINELIRKNNEYGSQLDKQKRDARNKLRLDEVYKFCTDIQYTETLERQKKEELEMRASNIKLQDLESCLADLKKRKKQKELDKRDEGKAAQKVTTLLENHFGNKSLSLEPETVGEEVDEETGEIKPRTHFVVKRGGVNAQNLSEGEKSLISFCYFIAQMDDELKGPEANKLVIFIDDPISSLDSSHIFFMYSLIETVIVKPGCYGQLYISTHNLEFLKFTKRLDKMPGLKAGKLISKYVVMKLGKWDTDIYRCEIKQMPEYLSKYVTEYNFLFEQIYEVAKLNGEERALYDNQYTLYYNIGNNMRKFLECYLFNRYPDTDNPLKEHLEKMFDNHIPSEVNRVVNEYSHLSWAERGMRVMDVPEVEEAAKQILKALRTKDREHYETLCRSISVDANIDL